MLIALQFAVTWTSVRWPGFARAVRSEPTLLVRNGEPCTAAMRRQRITAEEVESAIRASGGHQLADAATVVLESDGTVSVALR